MVAQTIAMFLKRKDKSLSKIQIIANTKIQKIDIYLRH